MKLPLLVALLLTASAVLYAQIVVTVRSPNGEPVTVIYTPPPIPSWVECRPAPGSDFPVGRTHVTCVLRAEPVTLEIVVQAPDRARP